MIFLKKIFLKNYRNFQEYENNFFSNSNVIFGKNGSGKTNLLESISLFDKGTGFRNDKLDNIINTNKSNFVNYGEICLDKQNYFLKVFVEKKNERFIKKILINNDLNKESLEFVRSFLSFIIFQPEMERLFLLSPSYRRKFIDRFIYSYNKNYNKLINLYKKNISERINILNSNQNDESWLSVIEENIAKTGVEIYKLRIDQLKILNEKLNNLYLDKKSPYSVKINMIDEFYLENPNIINDIDLYKNLLQKNRQIDSFSGGAKIGPHRSDFSGYIQKNFVLSQLSTGQQKTIVLLLILAQCNYLVNDLNIYPIVLMDEICSHLDEINRSILLSLLNDFNLQFFMTGTDKSLFSFLSTNTQYYNISE